MKSSRCSANPAGTSAPASRLAVSYSRAWRARMNGIVIDTSSRRAARIVSTGRSTSRSAGVAAAGPEARSVGTRAAMGEVLEEVQLRHDARGPARDDGDNRGRATGKQAEGIVERRPEVDGRERRIHHLADGPLDHGRVAISTVEQALLAHRADDRLDGVALGLLRDRQLADPVQLQQVDRRP